MSKRVVTGSELFQEQSNWQQIQTDPIADDSLFDEGILLKDNLDRPQPDGEPITDDSSQQNSSLNNSGESTTRSTSTSETRPRTKHTGHKGLLSASNKIFKRLSRNTKQLRKILSTISRNGSYPQSSFVKQIMLARKLGIFNQFKRIVPSLFNNAIISMRNKGTRVQRIIQAQDWKKIYEQVLQFEDWIQQLQTIWGDHNHGNKLEESEKDVQEFKQQIEKYHPKQ